MKRYVPHAPLLYKTPCCDEEKNHELLAIRDLEFIKKDIKNFTEYSETSAYYQGLYYSIEADGPYSLLGYFLPLEGLAAEGLVEVADTLIDTYTKKGASFVNVHCKLDEGHFEEGLKFLDSLTQEQLTIVRKYMHLSTDLYIAMLRRVKSEFELKSKKRAA